MKAKLIACTAAALIAFVAATSSANAADKSCRGVTATVKDTDGSTKVVCITLSVAKQSESVSIEEPAQHELWAKLVLALEEHQFQANFDPTDVNSIEAIAKELGITIDTGEATLHEVLALQDMLGERKSVKDVMKDMLGKMTGDRDFGVPATREELLAGAIGENPIDEGPVDPGSGIGAIDGGYSPLVKVDAPGYYEGGLYWTTGADGSKSA